ncbi:MAG: hypothetical protein PVJ09_02725 [Candidatus Woesebacteria bacterium]|jgi:hypothetical protein
MPESEVAIGYVLTEKGPEEKPLGLPDGSTLIEGEIIRIRTKSGELVKVRVNEILVDEIVDASTKTAKTLKVTVRVSECEAKQGEKRKWIIKIHHLKDHLKLKVELKKVFLNKPTHISTLQLATTLKLF